MNDDRKPAIRVTSAPGGVLVSSPLDPEREAFEAEIEERLQGEPGAVIFRDSYVLDDGRLAFRVGLNCVPPGNVRSVLYDRYPKIVTALMAQGHHVPPDSVITLVSALESDEQIRGWLGEKWRG